MNCLLHRALVGLAAFALSIGSISAITTVPSAQTAPFLPLLA